MKLKERKLKLKKKMLAVLLIAINFSIGCLMTVYAQDEISNKEELKYEVLLKLKQEDIVFFTKSSMNLEVKELSKIKVKKIKVNSKNEYTLLMEELKNNPCVEYAEPNIKYSKMTMPDDALIGDDWGIDAIQAPMSWDLTVGSSETVIAVIDTGVEMDNPELSDRIIQGYDFVNEDDCPDDDDGHGTIVSQVLGARANNGICSAGVTWKSLIMPIKALDENGDGFVDDIADAIVYATDNGADIINLSLGGVNGSNTIHEAVIYAYENGVLLVGASGNAEDITKYSVYYPAAYQEVMAVGAIDENELLADFSCRGSGMSIVAPGVGIPGYKDGCNYFADGTSFSAPYVSGAAALVWSLNPSLGNSQVVEILEKSATDIGLTGWDEGYGYGVLNVHNAVLETLSLINEESEFPCGDYNGNNIIDIIDLIKTSLRMGKEFGDLEFSNEFDINNDKIIDILDLNIQILNYGKSY